MTIIPKVALRRIRRSAGSCRLIMHSPPYSASPTRRFDHLAARTHEWHATCSIGSVDYAKRTRKSTSANSSDLPRETEPWTPSSDASVVAGPGYVELRRILITFSLRLDGEGRMRMRRVDSSPSDHRLSSSVAGFRWLCPQIFLAIQPQASAATICYHSRPTGRPARPD